MALKTFDDFHKVKNLIVITSLIKRYVDLVTDKRQLIKNYSLDLVLKLNNVFFSNNLKLTKIF